MAQEGRAIADKIERNLRDLIGELSGVPDDDLNRALEVQPSNTLYQLGFHVLGSTRFWAVTMAGGEDFHRDRPSEFVSSGAGAGLIADLESLIDRVHAQLDSVGSDTMTDQAAVLTVSRPDGRNDLEMTVRGSLLHAIEHTALHLGHAQITRQLLGYAPVRTE